MLHRHTPAGFPSVDRDARLRDLEDDPDTAWRVSPDDWKSHRDYDRLSRLAERMRSATHSRSSPWHVIDAADARTRNLAVGDTLLARFHEHIRAQARTKRKSATHRTVPLRTAGLRRLQALPLDHRLSESDYEAKRDKCP